MIFKLSLNNKDYKNIVLYYICICPNKLLQNSNGLFNSLYKQLNSRKIFTLPSSQFDYQITSYLSPYTIDCFTVSNKSKLFCRLEQLMMPIAGQQFMTGTYIGYAKELIRRHSIQEPIRYENDIPEVIRPVEPPWSIFHRQYNAGIDLIPPSVPQERLGYE